VFLDYLLVEDNKAFQEGHAIGIGDAVIHWFKQQFKKGSKRNKVALW